jgi:cyclic lactone autoinducer peptide
VEKGDTYATCAILILSMFVLMAVKAACCQYVYAPEEPRKGETIRPYMKAPT